MVIADQWEISLAGRAAQRRINSQIRLHLFFSFPSYKKKLACERVDGAIVSGRSSWSLVVKSTQSLLSVESASLLQPTNLL